MIYNITNNIIIKYYLLQNLLCFSPSIPPHKLIPFPTHGSVGSSTVSFTALVRLYYRLSVFVILPN